MKRIVLFAFLSALGMFVTACGSVQKMTGELVVTSIKPDTSVSGAFDISVMNIGSGDAWIIDPTMFASYDARGAKIGTALGAPFTYDRGIDHSCDANGRNCENLIHPGTTATLFVTLNAVNATRVASDLAWFNVDVSKYDPAYLGESKETHSVPYARP